MSAHEHTPVPSHRPAVGSVASEMEAIFVAATGLPSRPRTEPAPRPKARFLSPSAPSARKPAQGVAGALAAAALAGVALGAILSGSPLALHRSASAPAPAAVAAPERLPVSTGAPYAPEPTLTVPLAVERRGLQRAVSPAVARPVVRQIAHRSAGDACRAARCTHSELMAADRRLRVAYAKAVRAGVPRPVLVSYRNRWASLRHDAVDRPNQVANGYGAMAGDLNRMAQRRGARRQGSWRS